MPDSIYMDRRLAAVYEVLNPAAADTGSVLGEVEVSHHQRDVAGDFVAFDTHFHFSDGDAVAEPSTLRFMAQDELAGFLADAGFDDITWYGDWDRSPIGATSPEMFAIAGKAA